MIFSHSRKFKGGDGSAAQKYRSKLYFSILSQFIRLPSSWLLPNGDKMTVIIPGITSAFIAVKRGIPLRTLVAFIPFERKVKKKSFLTRPNKLPVISQRPDCFLIFKRRKKKFLDFPASVTEASKVDGVGDGS